MKPDASSTKRLASLDTLRGFDMMFIMGVSSLIVAICNLFPGGSDCFLATQMTHVEWNGWQHTDTIFPLFLFIAGISWPYSYSKRLLQGDSRGAIYRKIFGRGAALVALGLAFNGFFNFHFSTLRFFSVLGRIGLAWMFAALIYVNFKPKARALVAAVILFGYWVLCMIPAPDVPGADPLSHDGCLVGYIDRCLFPGHLNDGNFDPEGLLSTLPAIVTALLGMFTGDFVRREDVSGNSKTLYMFAAAAVLLGLGYIWNIWFPINKKLWTSSFVLVLGAYSLASFALFYWIIDVRGWNGWTMPLRVIGMNSITIYMAQRIIPFWQISDFFFKGLSSLCSKPVAEVISLTGYILVSWLFLYFLYRKKVFLRV